MSLLALVLVFSSAILHAFWNFVSKKAGGGIPFVWLFMAVSSVFYAPIVIAIIIYQQVRFDLIDWLFIIGTTLVHLVYFIFLQTGYRIGDFSIIYPIGRGTAPLLSSVAAIFIFQETATVQIFTGIILIIVGIFILTGGFEILKKKNVLIPILYGLVIGISIAVYTIIDKGAVSNRNISPILLEYFSGLGQFIILTPYILTKWHEVKFEWQNNRKEAYIVGVFHSLAYMLVLGALAFSPVTHIAPLREISILIGVLLGVKFLKEDFGPRRIIASMIIIAGVVTLSLSK